MATKRTKEDSSTEENQKSETVLEDRFSELPDCIILHILLLLPTLDAVRMSLLSKRWRHMWTMVPVLDFHYSRDVFGFGRNNKRSAGSKLLFKFLDECLKCPYAGTTVSKFKLDMEFFGSSNRVDNWLAFPVNKNVKELEIRIGNRRSLYILPRTILHLRSLTQLQLSGMALGAFSTAKLPNLKTLYFFDVEMDDQVLSNILSGSPALEVLEINHCPGLLDPQVTSSSLKSMVFRIGCHTQTINVEATNLRSFQYGSPSIRCTPKCSINLVRCHEIRDVSIHDVCLTDLWIEDLIPQLHFLERLNLDHCYGLERMKICNHNLKKIEFTSDCQFFLVEAVIDAPSLVNFRYNGLSLFKISVNATSLINAEINVSDYYRNSYDVLWFLNLIKFLSEFNGCENVHLLCSSKKAFIVPEELRKNLCPPLPDLKYLKVNTEGSKIYKKNIFRESLLWIAPSLDTLSIT